MEIDSITKSGSASSLNTHVRNCSMINIFKYKSWPVYELYKLTFSFKMLASVSVNLNNNSQLDLDK